MRGAIIGGLIHPRADMQATSSEGVRVWGCFCLAPPAALPLPRPSPHTPPSTLHPPHPHPHAHAEWACPTGRDFLHQFPNLHCPSIVLRSTSPGSSGCVSAPPRVPLSDVTLLTTIYGVVAVTSHEPGRADRRTLSVLSVPEFGIMRIEGSIPFVYAELPLS